MLTMVSSGARSRTSRTACGLGNCKITIFRIFESGPPLLGNHPDLLSKPLLDLLLIVVADHIFCRKSGSTPVSYLRQRAVYSVVTLNGHVPGDLGIFEPESCNTLRLPFLRSINYKMIESVSTYVHYGRFLP